MFLGTTKAKGRVARDEGFPTGEMVDPKKGWKIWKEIVGWILIRSGQIKNRPLTSFLVCLKFEGFMIVHKQEKVELDGRKHMVLSRRFQRFFFFEFLPPRIGGNDPI